MEILYLFSILIAVITGIRMILGQLFNPIVTKAKWYWKLENFIELALYIYFILYSLIK